MKILRELPHFLKINKYWFNSTIRISFNSIIDIVDYAF